MKKVLAVLVVVLVSLCLVVSFAFAGDVKAMVKSVDAKHGKIVVTIDGKVHKLKAAKGVDLGSVKTGDAVEISMHKHMLKSIKAAEAAPAAAPAAAAPAPAPKKPQVGC